MLHFPLTKAVLKLAVLYTPGALFVIMSHVINSVAYGIAPHHPSIEGPQQFGYRKQVLHTRIEPEIVAVWIKDDDAPNLPMVSVLLPFAFFCYRFLVRLGI